MMTMMMMMMMMTEVWPKKCHEGVVCDNFLVSTSSFDQQPHSLKVAHDDDDDDDDDGDGADA
eukprot:3753432-Karenia_brevis.AAC.1